MQPRGPGGEALLATVDRLGQIDDLDLVDVRAGGHGIFSGRYRSAIAGLQDSNALDEVRTADGRILRVEPIEPIEQTADVTMPDEFQPRRLARRTLQIVALL